jgi:uncharacterized YigZ family protein
VLNIVSIFNSYIEHAGIVRTITSVKTVSKFIADDIKKSRFIVQISPASDVTEALAFIGQVADAKASHNCWAFKSIDYERCSDDGEPAGTAGKPILSAINSENLHNCVVVVTRYFGGIKLGTGGLARAYASVARDAMRVAEKVVLAQSKIVIASVLLSDVGILFKQLQKVEALDNQGGFQRINEEAIRVELAYLTSATSQGSTGAKSADVVDAYEVKFKCSESLAESFSIALKDACRGIARVLYIIDE